MATANPHPKRLIIGCDGTWQSADTGSGNNPTNVINFLRALTHNAMGDRKEQIIFYQAGVATGGVLPVQKMLAGGMGLGLEENAEDAYSFIAHNYVEGDEIFILGFSRGAYTARFVAGLLGKIGMLSRVGMRHFKPIIEIYKEAQNSNEFDTKLQAYKINQKTPMNTHDYAVTGDKINIKAVSCWETVGAMGVPENTLSKLLKLNAKWDFLNTQLPLRVEFAFQSLGLDEHRSSFSPTLWWVDPTATWQNSIDNRTIKPELIQCWFPGHHSDVGGGNPDQKIQNITLAWMIDQFASRGLLDFDTEFVQNVLSCTKNNADPDWSGNKDPFDDGALSVVWHLLGSKTRTPGQYKNPKVNTSNSVTNEVMHFSVREKMEQIAKPGANPPLPLPSPALAGFEYDEESRRWVWNKGTKGSFEMPEFGLPPTGSMQSWLCGDWLKSQDVEN
ncbi:hypothetical protein N431DRAFT_320847 [Stipitochalara longipes BDJ]|nr:hypothetical protein N431DRAFT_320847 [Stipitochalara longipes BDJ]